MDGEDGSRMKARYVPSAYGREWTRFTTYLHKKEKGV
nr:MAG TPA: hypothetical protein [Caudoviricetes sp.]